MFGTCYRRGGSPFDQGTSIAWSIAQHHGSSAVAKQACADEYPRIVIQVHSGTTDLHADREKPSTAFGRDEGFGRLPDSGSLLRNPVPPSPAQ